MSRDGGTTAGSRWLHPCTGSILKKGRWQRPCARVAMALGVVLFALWNFSISARVVPKDHQLKVDAVMMESYLAEGGSVKKSAAYNKTVQTKFGEEEHSESVSLSTNASLSVVHEKHFDASSILTGNSSTLVSNSNSNTSVTSPPTNDADYDKEGLPAWVTNYFEWHGQMRQQFPDQELFEHDDAPKILLKYCKWKDRVICGGLYDRMGTIPKVLYVANRTNRVLLIKWYVPMKVETFLLPVAINWTSPHHDRLRSRNFFRNNLQKPKSAKHFIQWALDKPAVDEHLLVVHREANSLNLKKELLALNETDTIEKTTTFGKLWRALFRPSPLVQDEIDATMESLGLEPGKYSATHCRVRHPGRFAEIVSGKNGSEADVTGLPWHGPNKEMALASAVRALQCTQWLSNSTEEPVYFYSDSEDLVHHLLVEQNQSKTETTTLLAKNNETKLDRKRRSVLKSTILAARDVSRWPTAHLDRQVGLPAEAYVSTFVDLYIAASARCISFGVGNFGYLAAKISGTDCVVLHEKQQSRGKARMWNQQTGGARKCPIKK
jgi:hypothetical protein